VSETAPRPHPRRQQRTRHSTSSPLQRTRHLTYVSRFQDKPKARQYITTLYRHR